MISREIEHTMFLMKHERDKVMKEFVKKRISKT